MRCDQCRHWGKSDRWDLIAAKMGTCAAIKPGWRIADQASMDIPYTHEKPDEWDEEWNAAKIDPGDRYMRARSMALAAEKATLWDGSEYIAEICTTGDFFCAKFDAGDKRD